MFLRLLVSLTLALYPEGASHDIARKPAGVSEQIVFSGGSNIRVITPSGDDMKKVTDGPFRSSEPSWSPDGLSIVYTCRTGARAYKVTAEICIMDETGTRNRQITFNDKADGNPRWSPDGRWIVFERLTGRRWDFESLEIFKIRTDGSTETRLTFNRVMDVGPDWSPDGRQIVFESHRNGDSGIYRMTSDGALTLMVKDEPRTLERAPSWSPGGKLIAYESGGQLFIVHVSGAPSTHVIRGHDPVWSPDGRWLIYSGWHLPPPLKRVRFRDGVTETIYPEGGFSPDWR